ncbi:hypothetical protein IRJ41_024801, partial [Triplophysa rosa]
VSSRQRLFADGPPTITDCQMILRGAKPDFLNINANLQNGLEISNTDMTMFRYYCEALLVFHHMQCPQAVESLTDSEHTSLDDEEEPSDPHPPLPPPPPPPQPSPPHLDIEEACNGNITHNL